MSLDVYLSAKNQVTAGINSIFIREDGQTRQITREEWDEKFPGAEPFVVSSTESDEVYSANITHNLNAMAEEAGIYKHLWRPDEIGITQAHQLIEPLEQGLRSLKEDPERFKKLNPSNGWGNYEGLIRFTENYLNACKQHPDAEVSVSR